MWEWSRWASDRGERVTKKRILPACESDRGERVIAMRESACTENLAKKECVCVWVCARERERKRSEMSASLIVDRKIYYNSVTVKEPRECQQRPWVWVSISLGPAFSALQQIPFGLHYCPPASLSCIKSRPTGICCHAPKAGPREFQTHIRPLRELPEFFNRYWIVL